MPVIPLREFGRKPATKSRPKTQSELEAERNLDQALGRLQAALPIGFAGLESSGGIDVSSDKHSISADGHSISADSHSRWFVADVSAQQQASKAILGLADAIAEHYRALERDAGWSKKVQVNFQSLEFDVDCLDLVKLVRS